MKMHRALLYKDMIQNVILFALWNYILLKALHMSQNHFFVAPIPWAEAQLIDGIKNLMKEIYLNF